MSSSTTTITTLRRFVSAFTLAAACLASPLGASDAAACTLPEGGWHLINASGAAPANGVMVMHYTCYVDCEDTPDPGTFALTRADGELVAGEVILSGEDANGTPYVVFRPEPGAFTAEEQYTATLEGASPFYGALIAEDTPWTAITPMDELFEVDHPAGETVCCESSVDSCDGMGCFSTEIDRTTAVAVTWTDVTLEASQYAYRLSRDGTDEGAPWMWAHGSAGFELTETEESACYVLELQKLVDGTVQRFEERCVERPATFTPGRQPTPEQTLRDALGQCDDPPAGYEDKWCATREELCQLNVSQFYCDSFAMRCEATEGQAGGAGMPPTPGGSAGFAGDVTGNGGAPRGGNAGASGVADEDSGGKNAAGGAPDQGDAGETSKDGERVYTKGCGCTVPGTNDHSTLSLFGALGLAALLSRRRRCA